MAADLREQGAFLVMIEKTDTPRLFFCRLNSGKL